MASLCAFLTYNIRIVCSAWIISIGTELSLGQTVDTNAAWLAAELAAVGVRAARHVTVADELADIRDILCEAARKCDLIVITGGLGPTDDDLTRQAIADAAGVELHEQPEALKTVERFFAALQRVMPPANRVQALIPDGGTVLPNTCGTAPGIFIKLGLADCFALPGVPHEMQAMFSGEVAPRIKSVAGEVVQARILHCFGLGESEVGEKIRDLMQRGRNPEFGTTAQAGIIGIRVNAAAPNAYEAGRMLDAAEAELRNRLGGIIFGTGDETLAAKVGELLAKAGATLALAESCTGGLLGKLITDVAGSSRYFVGGVVSYANSAKAGLLDVPQKLLETEGAVSEATALAMAAGAKRAFGADYALAITGIAGPAADGTDKPVGLVYIALATPQSNAARRYLVSNSPRWLIRQRAALTALNWLRLTLLER